MKVCSAEELGALIREVRKKLGVTQKDLAMSAGTGLRFIVDLEKGKPTCETGKTLQVLSALGLGITISPGFSRDFVEGRSRQSVRKPG